MGAGRSPIGLIAAVATWSSSPTSPFPFVAARAARRRLGGPSSLAIASRSGASSSTNAALAISRLASPRRHLLGEADASVRGRPMRSTTVAALVHCRSVSAATICTMAPQIPVGCNW